MSTQHTSLRSKRKLLVFMVSGIALILLAWYVNNYVSLEALANQEDRLRRAISLNPWSSFWIGFGVYTILSFVPGTGGKAIVSGWLFGFWQAVIIVSVGLTFAAMAIFTLSRYLFQESIERRYSSFLRLMNKHLEKEGAFYLLTLRMAHAPYSIVNPVSGASRIKTWTFFWTTVVGLAPANAIWIFVGMRLPSLRELAANGPSSFIDTPLIIALVSCAFLPVLVRWLIGRFGFPGFVSDSHDATRHTKEKENT